jgi:hypothetical protein
MTQRVGLFGILVFATVFMAADTARADPGVAIEASLGLFVEFGDEAGTSGGFTFWVGRPVYPSVDPSSSGAAFFVSPGVELRTGFIPLLTGPNQISPQLRPGLALLGPRDERRDGLSSPPDLIFPQFKIAGVVGFRWSFAFGLDNPEGRRKTEGAMRLGLDLRSIELLRITAPVVIPNVFGGHVDVNTDGTFDRSGLAKNTPPIIWLAGHSPSSPIVRGAQPANEPSGSEPA